MSVYDLSEPVVIRGVLDWSLLDWSLQDWENHFQPYENFPIRKGQFKCSKFPHWERSCDQTTVESKAFFKFIQDSGVKKDEWHYFDYKHIDLWFKNKDFLKNLSWNCLKESIDTPNGFTLWIGSSGAHTPLHYDTYGTNIVAQINGEKLWILFPPCATPYLKPTRVPYEESSVYSDINLFCACSHLPDEALSKAKLVILKPGDILYVPSHWWHYVENMSSAISINSWIPLKNNGDCIHRLEESIVSSLIGGFLKDLHDDEKNSILNPNEDDQSDTRNLDLINIMLNDCNNTRGSKSSKRTISDFEEAGKKFTRKSVDSSLNTETFQVAVSPDGKSDSTEVPCRHILMGVNRENVLPIKDVDKDFLISWLKRKCVDNVANDENVESGIRPEVKKIINAVCHPEVIEIMVKNMLS